MSYVGSIHVNNDNDSKCTTNEILTVNNLNPLLFPSLNGSIGVQIVFNIDQNFGVKAACLPVSSLFVICDFRDLTIIKDRGTATDSNFQEKTSSPSIAFTA